MLQLILQFILFTLLATFPLNSLLGYKMLHMLYFSEHFRALFHLPILVLIKLVCRKDKLIIRGGYGSKNVSKIEWQIFIHQKLHEKLNEI